jgi:hypothetical protein
VTTPGVSGAGRPGVAELLKRLEHPDPKVRHIAAMDLTRHAADPDARAALWRLYADPSTPARIAHAAILAHDAAIPDAKSL